MSESEKPFACPSPGCNMSFVNEDHLTVHRKRHEMILNLGSNGKAVGAFVADQTPTPTRFIRNCEEVGLFQDLQNVNPFEETFRRAVEAGKTGSLAVPEAGISDDTLHTPHIFPHIVDDPSSTNNSNNNNNNNNNSDNNRDLLENGVSDPPVISITDSSDEDVNKNTTSIEIRVEEISCDDNSKEKLKTVELDTDSQDDSIVETIVVQEAGTSISTTVLNLRNNHQQKASPQLSINGKEVQLLMKTEDGKLMQLSAVPVSQSEINPTTVNIQSNTQTVVIKTEPSLNYSEKKKKIVESTSSTRLSLAKMKLKQALTKNGVSPEIQEDIGQSAISQTKDNNNANNNQVIDITKKQDILERNRASSMRARAKRKAWIQQLERSVYNVNETNAVLQLEVRALRSEVAKLKTLLLAHKDCPVTKAMEQGNSIVLGPKIISLSGEVLQTSSTPGSLTGVKRASVISSELCEIPKKKAPSLSHASLTTHSSQMILPKSSIGGVLSPLISKNGKIIRNRISGIKVIEEDEQQQIVTTRSQDKNKKQILIVKNHQMLRKSSSIDNFRQIIRINPNLEIDNAASKSTGS